MGVSELRHLQRSFLDFEKGSEGVEAELVRAGQISAADAALAKLVQRQCDTSMDRILSAEGLAEPQAILAAHARVAKSRELGAKELLDLSVVPVDVPLARLLRYAVMPVMDRDGLPALVAPNPDAISALRSELPAIFANARHLWCAREAIQARLSEVHREALAEIAVTRVPAEQSCRGWEGRRRLRVAGSLAMVLGVVGVAFAMPAALFTLLAGWAVMTLVITAVFRLTAFLADRAQPMEDAPRADSAPLDRLPRVSILVPVFRETEILHALVARLSRITYPKCLLDVVLILEEEDQMTRAMLATIDLPPWIRAVVAPDGQPRTKPRAMNYALDFCEGEVIGVFDAEDAPDPDQITQVVHQFARADRDVVCLQGILDYYNPRQNWLSRCFTIEYAAWFRRILPGMARLGFAIPLGGTTLFFRRDALEQMGGWDAHNVTEDADLGFRLHRYGYRTQMVHTVTDEEANCLAWPWIKQRSRWLKGYMKTYLVHMRRPGRLFRELGPWRFLGFQAHFISALSQVLLAPVLWSFWLILFGLPHPFDGVVSPAVLTALCSVFVAIELLNMAIYFSAVKSPKHRHLLPWVPLMHFYTPLATVAAYKALYELVLKPFFWDKTRHGLSAKARRSATPQAGPRVAPQVALD
jgi:cellulose synthase/poly-beta-1,6-N-acetylglucosamine synthase-like glycosyltransferase